MLRLIRALRLDRVRGEEDGFALAVVIGIAAVLFVVTMGALSYSVSALTKAGTDTNGDAATAAAYAGVSDYEARLTNDNTYQKYGDPTAPFSAKTGSTTLVLPAALPDGTPGNPAFGWGVNGTWAPVPGATGNAAFRYEVDNSDYAAQGVIRILATGRSGNQTRSFIANVRQNGFLNYLYFTDFETQDPSLIGVSPTSTCAKYYPNRNENTCGGLIQFVDGEDIQGPVDSNDALNICGGKFEGTITSNYGTSPYYTTSGCSTNDPKNAAGQPIQVLPGPKLTMPATNTSMINETRGDLTSSTVPRPGCLYTGPTSIVFNSDGTMTVRSPWSKFMNTTGANGAGAKTGMATVPANECGTAGSATGDLGSPAGQTIPVPAENLIYVQTVPTIVGDANYWGSTTPAGAACASNGNDLGYPLNTTTGSGNSKVVTIETATKSPAGTNYYGCTAGDVFVKGTLSGQVTVAADNYVWVTGDLVYNPSDASSDILGLVGQNAVWVWNPAGTVQVGSGRASSLQTLLTDSGRTIDAAIMSVSHTFQVQNYSVASSTGGNRGNLTVLGAIAQEFRGTVGQSPAGYSKQYKYDTRFRSIAPPKFLQAVSTTYGVSQLAEVPAAFSSNGAST